MKKIINAINILLLRLGFVGILIRYILTAAYYVLLADVPFLVLPFPGDHWMAYLLAAVIVFLLFVFNNIGGMVVTVTWSAAAMWIGLYRFGPLYWIYLVTAASLVYIRLSAISEFDREIQANPFLSVAEEEQIRSAKNKVYALLALMVFIGIVIGVVEYPFFR